MCRVIGRQQRRRPRSWGAPTRGGGPQYFGHRCWEDRRHRARRDRPAERRRAFWIGARTPSPPCCRRPPTNLSSGQLQARRAGAESAPRLAWWSRPESWKNRPNYCTWKRNRPPPRPHWSQLRPATVGPTPATVGKRNPPTKACSCRSGAVLSCCASNVATAGQPRRTAASAA